VQRADVRVTDPPDRPGFPLEPFELNRAGVAWGDQNLDGDCAIETEVTGVINLPHATRSEQLEDLVRTELSASV
jgi:hypothetical protein